MKQAPLIAILAFSALTAFSCSFSEPDAHIRNGVADLRQHDFSAEPIVRLEGYWRFIPDRLVEPEELENKNIREISVPIWAPGAWKTQEYYGGTDKTFGEGTYVLDVLLPADHPPMTFYKDLVHCSARIYLNGITTDAPPVTDVRDIAKVATNHPEYYRYDGKDPNLRIVIQVTNWWDWYGAGIQAMPRLGTATRFDQTKLSMASYESFVAGVLIIAAFYHFVLFGIQRRNKTLLWFAFTTIASLLLQLSTSEMFWLTRAGFRYAAVLRLSHAAAYLSGIFITLYFNAFYPADRYRFFSKYIIAIGIGLTAVVSFTPVRVFSYLVTPLNLYVLIAGLNGFAILIKALRRGVPQALPMILGLLILYIPTILDVLATSHIVFGEVMTPLGLVFFVMIHSYVLAKRYTRDTIEAETLRVTTARLTELDEMKTRFLANVSHELRTPVTLIKAPVTAIQDGEYGESIARNHSVFTLIRTNVDRLLALIEKILDLTRLEDENSMELIPIDLIPVIKGLFEEFKDLAALKGLRFVTDIPAGNAPIVSDIDIHALETVLFNLVSNAIKLTPPGGTVKVAIATEGGLKADHARISVEDTGIGIPPEALERIFLRYRQIYSTERRHYEGMGLGLSIAQETAKALGGRIEAKSEQGKGSAFSLILPISDRAPVDSPPRPGVQASKGPDRSLIKADLISAMDSGEDAAYALMAGGREGERPSGHEGIILVVEDQDLRKLIANVLSRDYSVIEAEDGMEARHLLERGLLPDLILSDIMMPRMDGTELLAGIRANSRWDTVAFVFLTARDEPSERERMLTQGSLDYIVKPFTVAEIRAKVQAVMDNRDRTKRGFLEKVRQAVQESPVFNPRGTAAPVIDSPLAPAPHPHKSIPSGLSQRETEVLNLILEGCGDKEIASRLGISTRTASNHVASIMRKTGVSGRNRLVAVFGQDE